jgi:hypothetical protein
VYVLSSAVYQLSVVACPRPRYTSMHSMMLSTSLEPKQRAQHVLHNVQAPSGLCAAAEVEGWLARLVHVGAGL